MQMENHSWEQRFCQLRDQFMEAQYPHLNSAQKEAVLNADGPMLVLAGAGSGKTTMLVNRISHLIRFGPAYGSESIPPDVTSEEIAKLETWMNENENDLTQPAPLTLSRLLEWENVEPHRILAITFTNKAAREMKERVQERLRGRYHQMWISTFHAACARILRKDIHRIGYGSNFVIYDGQDQKIVVKECIKSMKLEEKKFPPGMVSGYISKRKDAMISPEDCLKEAGNHLFSKNLALLYQQYEKRLKQNNALDFDDLILKTLALFREAPDVLKEYQQQFTYVLVDEFQDTNRPQYLWARAIAKGHGNLSVVGDDDQSIYGWRGADIGNILGFEKDFPHTRTVKLEQNYRSTATILEAANGVVSNNRKRKAKKLFTHGDTGEPLVYASCSNEYQEADFLVSSIRQLTEEGFATSDMAVLYRTHAQSRVLEDGLMKAQIPYRIYGGTRFYDRKEIRDVLAYLKTIENPKDDVSLKRIINVPRRGIGDKTVETLETIASDHQRSLTEVLGDSQLLDLAHLRSVSKTHEFIRQLKTWIANKDQITLTDLTKQIYDDTQMIHLLKKEGSIESLGRVENLMEFLSLTREFDADAEDKTLESFLAGTSLEAVVDNMDETDTGVTLMTLHSAKGLEFPVVFMPGMEEGLFPSNMALSENPDNIEEERRLCYVGLTRAKHKLYLSSARSRTIFGKLSYTMPSCFLDEIPEKLIHQCQQRGSDQNEVRQRERWRRSRQEDFQKPGSFPGMDPEIIDSVKPIKGNTRNIEEHSYGAGARVRHPSFGEGTVVSQQGDIVTIAFPDLGIKRITLGYVPLTFESDHE